MMILKLEIAYDPPPIPIRQFDWNAVTDNYEPGEPIGFGRTAREAVNDLLDLLEEKYGEPIRFS